MITSLYTFSPSDRRETEAVVGEEKSLRAKSRGSSLRLVGPKDGYVGILAIATTLLCRSPLAGSPRGSTTPHSPFL